MRQKSETPHRSSEQVVKDIRRATRKQYSAEEKIRIVLDGLRGESSIAELCGTPLPRSSRSSGWSSSRICRSGAQWKNSAFHVPLFTTGMISIDQVARRLWKIVAHGQTGCGTASPTR